MKRFVVPLAVAMAAAVPALAQQQAGQPLARGQYLAEAQLAPVRDVLSAVQQRLRQMGYGAGEDGHFDAATRNGVLRFQAEHGLDPTGNIDVATISALGINLGGATVAAAPPAGNRTAALREPTLAERNFRNPHIPLLRFSEYMSSPQYLGQGAPIEDIRGIPRPTGEITTGEIAGMPAGTFIDTINGGLWD
ncbi:MAG: peptidoglycan-binding domain-containing protein [Actinomycetota bacterium]